MAADRGGLRRRRAAQRCYSSISRLFDGVLAKRTAASGERGPSRRRRGLFGSTPGRRFDDAPFRGLQVSPPRITMGASRMDELRPLVLEVGTQTVALSADDVDWLG